MTLRQLLSYVRKACDDYEMIADGDKIAVGISGGKDSLTMLAALNALKRFYPKRFEIVGITVSLGLPGCDFESVRELCVRLGVEYHVVETNIGQIIFDERKETNPCSLCSKMRKGALNNKALELGCTRVALGHSKDDLCETFFMSLFYEGRLNTFAPVSYLDRAGLYSIRPLIYTDEKDIISFVKKENIQIVKSPCPADGLTKRRETKDFMRTQAKVYDNFQDKIFGAIKRSGLRGWAKDIGAELPRGYED